MLVIVLKTCPDWQPHQTEDIQVVACTYQDGEDYFAKAQLLFDLVGLPIGHPFDVSYASHEITLSEDDREQLDYRLKSGTIVKGRNQKRDSNAWVLRTMREVKNGQQV